MKPNQMIRHEFVEFMPDKLKEGIVYISVPFATAAHLCFCGCNNEVVTPFSPTDWILSFDGLTISLEPSIGNWSFKCQSHYWVRQNQIIWAPKWSKEKVENGRKFDRGAKVRYYNSAVHNHDKSIEEPKSNSFWTWLKQSKGKLGLF